MYPAQAIFQALDGNAHEVLWVGSESGMEKDLVRRSGIPYEAIPAAGLHGVGIKTLPGNISQLLKGVRESRRILHEFKPDCLLYTGGYVAAPMAFAARKKRSLLFVPDIEPGLAIRFLARNATIIALTNQESVQYFDQPNKLRVTGYPLRNELMAWTPEKSRKALHLNTQYPILLVAGGSKGARSINRALSAQLSQILNDWQVVHITGQLDWNEISELQKKLPSKSAGNYHPYPYLHEEMGAALASANLVISRSGASTLGEYPAFGLPAILVPYPHTWRYQKVNADYLVNHQAARLIRDEDLSTQLLPMLINFRDHPQQLKSMAAAMRKLNTPDAAQRIADLLLDISKSSIGGIA